MQCGRVQTAEIRCCQSALDCIFRAHMQLAVMLLAVCASCLPDTGSVSSVLRDPRAGPLTLVSLLSPENQCELFMSLLQRLLAVSDVVITSQGCMQAIPALSSGEAELIAIRYGSIETLFVKHLVEELGHELRAG